MLFEDVLEICDFLGFERLDEETHNLRIAESFAYRIHDTRANIKVVSLFMLYDMRT